MKKPLLLILIAVLLLPFIVRPAIASEIWLFAIFGLGANLLLGYTGLLSFGQSTFFGSAAYVAGWLMKIHGVNALLALGIGVGVGAGSAAVVGYLCVQRSGLYFIMLTFALNQLFYFTAYQWTSITGGEDGMPGVPRPVLLGIDFKDPLVYYAFVSLLFLTSLYLMKRIVGSPLGRILQAIRENEVRAGAVGYDVARFKLLLRHRRRLLGPRRRALRDALRHRAAGGDQLRVLRQRDLRHTDRRLGLPLRAGDRLLRLHLALRVHEHRVGALAAAAGRGLCHRGDVFPRWRR
jgi:branched-subunit amino acid transport system permease